jgi:hypothetical protein
MLARAAVVAIVLSVLPRGALADLEEPGEPISPGLQLDPERGLVARDASKRPVRKRHREVFFLGAGAVAMIPLGGWSDHAYSKNVADAAGLQQFGPGGGIQINAGLHFRRFVMAVELEISSLDTHNWDHWAALHGNSVHSRAMCLGLYATLGGIFAKVGPVAFAARAGIGYTQPFGDERFEDLGLSYAYAFLKPTFTFARTGVYALWAMARRLDLVLGIDSTLGTSPIRDHGETVFVAFTFNLQLRLWLGARPWR